LRPNDSGIGRITTSRSTRRSFLLSWNKSSTANLEGCGIFSREGVRVEWKQNLAVDVSRFVLQAVSVNSKRHDAVQRFLLATDVVTVAAEVPVLIRPEDWVYFQRKGYEIPGALEGVVTGRIHILDFKPGARSVDAVDQLTIYALAFSRLTGIPLFEICCGWFDETSFYEFWPLDVVKKRRESKNESGIWAQAHLKGA
jgi:hypothetical protein